MRILVVGAGALGGYFGGRLAESGADVTFLVRARRAAQLAATGLRIRSPYGDFVIEHPRTVSRDEIGGPYDLVIVACKAYDLAATIEDFAPSVGEHTAVLPLLNGLQHVQVLTARFGHGRVLGGLCLISAVLDDEGTVLHLNRLHDLTFGELTGQPSERTQAFATLCAAARFNGTLTNHVLQAMWEKWIFIAAGAGITCLMRGPIGDIVTAGGSGIGIALYEECASIAAGEGHAPGREAVELARRSLTEPNSPWTSSMLKDVLRGARTEVEALIGDLLRRHAGEGGVPLLRVAVAHLRTYEAGRARLMSTE